MNLVAATAVVGGSIGVVASTSSIAGATNPLSGVACPVLGATLTYKNVTYTCIKLGKKLVWNGGVVHPAAPMLPTGNYDTTPAGKLLWQETFAGAQGTPPPSNVWTAVTGATGYGTGEVENNTTNPANLGYDGQGNLAITAKCIATAIPGCASSSQTWGSTWTSARIWTENKLNFQYGQIEARIWMPAGSFNWPAFWMMGQEYNSNQPGTGWPYCGELDIAEGLQNDSQDQATIHSNIPGSSADWGEGTGLTQVAPLTKAQMTGGWHNYGILWTPNSIVYILDGKAWAMETYNPTTKDVTQTVGTTSLTVGPGTAISSEGGNWPFNAPFFLILNDAVGGAASPVAPNGSTATMKINWVKAYQDGTYGAVTVPKH